MTRFVLSLAFALLLAAQPAGAGVTSLEESLADKVLGDPKAPVTILEHSSLGCPHCAAFHKETLPRIKAEYIDTGKAKLIFRDFPLGAPALAASMVARCGGAGERYFGFLELLFQTQAKWAGAPNPLKELENIAKMGGMSPQDVQQCMANEALMKGLQENQKQSQIKYNVEATPTFVVNATRIPGAVTYDDFKKVLDAELAKIK
ncbi:MAG: DsbA family protein [Magnetospirillum sp. WYHS-4]